MELTRLQELLLSSKTNVYVVATGAGASIQRSLWRPPGASDFFVGATFPYDGSETIDFLGFNPSEEGGHGFCSEETAIDLGAEAYVRAKAVDYIKERNRPTIGIGVTAAVSSAKERRGENRFHLSVVSDVKGTPSCIVFTMTLPKGVGLERRVEDEWAVAYHTKNLLLEVLEGKTHLGSNAHGPLPDLSDTLRRKILAHPLRDPSGRRGKLQVDHFQTNNVPADFAFFPGSFDPLHAGHKFMGHMMEKPIVYAVCADHVHKPPLSAISMLNRLANFRAESILRKGGREDLGDRHPAYLYLSEGDPLLVDKLKRYPGQNWVLGADTFDRILDPKWGPKPSEVLDCIAANATSVTVFPAHTRDGGVLCLPDILKRYEGRINCPPLRHRHEVPPDVRSTTIREKMAQNI